MSERPLPAAEVLGAVPRRLHVGGLWRDAEGCRTFAVTDPATGSALVEVADAAPGDARAALDAARAAQRAWGGSAPAERAALLRAADAALRAERLRFATLIVLETGKPWSEALGEVDYAADYLRWYAEEAVRLPGRYGQAPTGSGRMIVTRAPVGPCLLIAPWNFPLAMVARKVAPALAAGCTVVVKPAEQAPLAALALVGLLAGLDLPAGVVNIVTTTAPAQVVEPLLREPALRKVSFTGSTAVGRRLLAVAADGVLRTSMELGGNAPFVVFADADLDHAVEQALYAKLRNGGEACTAANRMLVERPVAREFAERLAARMAQRRVGPGSDLACDLGPLIDERAVAKVDGLVADAVASGAEVLTGGGRIDGPGHFYAPTVLADVPRAARIVHEEIFGPVAAIVAFDDEQEAVELANASEYGLVAYVFTRDLGRALRVGEAVEAGMVGLNKAAIASAAAPFGGVKASGLGREGGPEGIEEYLETRYLAFDV
ncbi:NAD-dependent succinate-semialdehyde dehydrogenase [Conexibacter arvalis]|uniref:Succinate-semialdehyde dehydrogenase/glutarate-semialdehyde dehydrogenase n=1 Tax=Conexibacter arvalis TaxID=912552 RepID=A0A840ICY7_9ACTN|nr:NAD-dependent succinate-semialdehyde dehydrogenase [Conexibacter arvalis]MBB4662093.1 succinate-semialdehyde dehydrogenase/glutarate-semialdehyde dehydrogenase [Conexibacter arvalis]